MTDRVLIDTDVASFLFKKSPRARDFQQLVQGKQLALSFVSVGELFKWTIKQRWSTRKVGHLQSALQRYLVLPYDVDLAWSWARIVAACEQAGRPIPPTDAWIAAAAVRYDLLLVTNNVRHFETVESECGLKLARV